MTSLRIRAKRCKVVARFILAKNAWEAIGDTGQETMTRSAQAGIENLLQLEPKITEDGNDDLELSLQADRSGMEGDVSNWKDGWLKIMKNAGKKHVEAIEQIDKAIKDLEKTRDALMMSDRHLLAAENKMDDLTIKRLTRKNPTMAAKFAELKDQEVAE
ncbi:MAG: HaeIII family restriction endonuclease [Acidobacteriota bacterium]